MSLAHSGFRANVIAQIAIRAVAGVGTIWVNYGRHLARLRELAELRAMDDTALKDIGISRIEIRAATDPVAGSVPAGLGPLGSGFVAMKRAPFSIKRIARVMASKE